MKGIYWVSFQGKPKFEILFGKGKFHGYFGKKKWSLFSRGWKVPWTFGKWMSILKDKIFVNFGKILLRDKNVQSFFQNNIQEWIEFCKSIINRKVP